MTLYNGFINVAVNVDGVVDDTTTFDFVFGDRSASKFVDLESSVNNDVDDEIPP